MTISIEKIIFRSSSKKRKNDSSIKKRSLKFRSQYRRNQISVSKSYEETKQESKSNKNEKYQFNKKKPNPKITTDEIETNQKIETELNFFEYLILLNLKLTFLSHARIKSFVRKRASVFFSNKKKFQLFNKFYFSIQLKTEEFSKKNKKKTSNRSTVIESEFEIDRDQKSEIQFINFTDESNRKTNRISYSKIIYFRNAIIILIINKVFSNQSKFRELSSKNVAIINFLYFLMSNSKKKKNNKTAITILNSIKNNFIERNVRYFQIWLNRFRHDFFQSKENRDLISKIYTNKISKSKAISSKSKKTEKKKFDKTFKFDQFNQSIEKFKNENLIYKVFIVHIIEHSIQNQREQSYRIEKLKRKFDDLFRKMKNYFRKSIELLNDRITATNRNRNWDRDHIKNRDRTQDLDHSKNRYKINKHHNISSSSFSFRNRHRHRNRNEKHDRKRKYYYKSFFESDSEENIRIVLKKRKRMFIVNKKFSSVHKRFSKMNRNRKRKRFRNRKNFEKKKISVIAIKWISIIAQVRIWIEVEIEIEIDIVSKIRFLNSKRRKSWISILLKRQLRSS